MIVEDNVADVLLMREAIREICPCPVEITTVSDGEQALSILTSGLKCDVIILDLSLPKMDGHTFLELYKTNHPPIVIFSSSWNEADSKRALSLGAREFIHKPTTYDGYVESVCGIIEKWGRPDNAEAAEAPN